MMELSDISATQPTDMKAFGHNSAALTAVRYEATDDSFSAIIEQVIDNVNNVVGGRPPVKIHPASELNLTGSLDESFRTTLIESDGYIHVWLTRGDGFYFIAPGDEYPIFVDVGDIFVCAFHGDVDGMVFSPMWMTALPFETFRTKPFFPTAEEDALDLDATAQDDIDDLIARLEGKNDALVEELMDDWERCRLGTLAAPDSVFRDALRSIIIDANLTVDNSVTNVIYLDLWKKLADSQIDDSWNNEVGVSFGRATAEVLFWLRQDKREFTRPFHSVAADRIGGRSQANSLNVVMSAELLMLGHWWIHGYTAALENPATIPYIAAGIQHFDVIDTCAENGIDVDTARILDGVQTDIDRGVIIHGLTMAA